MHKYRNSCFSIFIMRCLLGVGVLAALGVASANAASFQTNPMEYFAESTEAYFSRNDYFPFNRAELKLHDAEMEKLLGRLWGQARPVK